MNIAYVTDCATDSDLDLGLPPMMNDILASRGGAFVVLDDQDFHFVYGAAAGKIFYQGQPFDPLAFDLLFLGDCLSPDLNREFLQRHLPVVNSPAAYYFQEDKIKFTALMQELGLPTPLSVAVRTIDQVRAAAATLPPPYVVKSSQGEGGTGVFRVESAASLLSVMECLWHQSPGQRFLIQEFIPTAAGDFISQDYRCTIIGDDLIPIVRQSKHDFRANWSRGGVGQVTALTATEIAMMHRIAQASGLAIMGIDFLKDQHGQIYFTELNQAPGLIWEDEQIDTLHLEALVRLFEREILAAQAAAAHLPPPKAQSIVECH